MESRSSLRIWRLQLLSDSGDPRRPNFSLRGFPDLNCRNGWKKLRDPLGYPKESTSVRTAADATPRIFSFPCIKNCTIWCNINSGEKCATIRPLQETFQ